MSSTVTSDTLDMPEVYETQDVAEMGHERLHRGVGILMTVGLAATLWAIIGGIAYAFFGPG